MIQSDKNIFSLLAVTTPESSPLVSEGSSASESVTFWFSVILWVLVVVSIVLVGVIACQAFRTVPVSETNAERQTRIQSVFDLLKFRLGTVAVGVLTLAVDQGIKQREEIVKERDQTNKETEEYSKLLPDVLNAKGDQRFLLADFFAHITRDPAFRTLWIQYRDTVKSYLDEVKKREDAVIAANQDTPPANATEDQKKSHKQKIKEL